MLNQESSVVFGVFKGMGDLLSAAPVIHQELKEGRTVHLMLFPSASLFEFCRLIDFSPHQQNLRLHAMPEGIRIASWIRFFDEMRRIDPDMVWVSPHAPVADSSWKIPLIMRFTQMLFWKKAQLAGADTERLSRLFHHRLPVDRTLPLRQREWSAYRLLDGLPMPEDAIEVSFLPEITRLREEPRYDLVIHPGATAKNRVWPYINYAPLLAALPAHWRVAFIGLPSDIDLIHKILPAASEVDLITGTIGKSLRTLASARLALVMDSGNMHFAQVLGLPAVAIFGYHDPSTVIDVTGCVEAIYDRRFPCQPCDKAICTQPEIYCINSVEPNLVAKRLKEKWEKMYNKLPSDKGYHIVQITQSK